MTITSAFVLFAVIWFLTFLIVIPFKIKTQGDLGTVATGTQAGAPEVHNLKKKAIITTGVTIVIWLLITVIIIFEILKIDDIVLFRRLS